MLGHAGEDNGRHGTGRGQVARLAATFCRAVSLLSRVPLHPFAFAAYSVLFVYAANLSEVLPVDAVAPVGRTLIATGAVMAVAMLLLRGARRGAIVASALVVAFAFFGHLYPELARLGLDERAQLGVWALALVAAVLVAIRARGSLGSVTLALNTFGALLLAISLSAILPYEAGRATRPSAEAPPTDVPLATATRQTDRDIIYLVFDRYGSEWSLEHRFAITDNDLPGWLADQGFQVIPGARSNYRATDFSLASTLNMRFLDELTRTVGRVSDDRTPARALFSGHELGTFLRANGYRYIHVAPWYAPTSTNDIADEVVEYGVDSEFETVLRDVSMAPVIERLMGGEDAVMDSPFRERHRELALFQLRQIPRLATAPGRIFLFAHVLLPHSPYVLAADGRTIFEAEAVARPEEDLFPEQLAYTNTRIREIVSALLAGPDESDPIIVIQADEGPFICGNVDCVDNDDPEDLGIRFGVLGAYYLPGLPSGIVPPAHSSVNTFRLILREYFGADLPPLPDRSYTWPDNEHLYDFQDITDLLPLPTTEVANP